VAERVNKIRDRMGAVGEIARRGVRLVAIEKRLRRQGQKRENSYFMK